MSSDISYLCATVSSCPTSSFPILPFGTYRAHFLGKNGCGDYVADSGDTSIKRNIRKQQLRAMVPLGDSTIYEMEQRGEFPRRCLDTKMRGLGLG
jgi:hypothetical protein